MDVLQQEIDNLDPTDQLETLPELAEGDRQIGVVDPQIQPYYRVLFSLDEQVKEIIKNSSGTQDPKIREELRTQYNRIICIASIAEGIFWGSVMETYNLWNTDKRVAVKKGWSIVLAEAIPDTTPKVYIGLLVPNDTKLQ